MQLAKEVDMFIHIYQVNLVRFRNEQTWQYNCAFDIKNYQRTHEDKDENYHELRIWHVTSKDT